MATWTVYWSLRGRVVVEAETEDEARAAFDVLVSQATPSDNDGYEVDDIE